MQPNFISPAQLLSGYLNDEHRKIGQDISTNQFSRELNAQQAQLASQSDASAFRSLSKDSTAVDTLNSSTAAQTTTQNTDNSTQAGVNVYFTNAPLLEKAIAQLKLPAETRKAIKTAEDSQGRISLKSLSQILGQYQPASGNLTESRVSAEDVQGILSSLQCGNSTANVGAAAVAGAKQQGSYSLGEFRQVVDSIATQALKAESKKSASLSTGKTQLATGSAAVSTVAGSVASPTESAGAKLSCPPGTVIPSFVEDDSGGNRDKKTASLETQTQDAKESAESTRQASRSANKSAADENSDRQMSQAVAASQSTQTVEGGVRQSEWVSSSNKVSSDDAQAADTASEPETVATATPDALSLLAQMVSQVIYAPLAEPDRQSNAQSDSMGELGEQTAAAVVGSNNDMANRVPGDKKSSPSFASADIESASGATPANTSIRPPQQTGGSFLDSSGNEGGGFTQSSSSDSGQLSAATDVNRFLRFSSKTAQNESAAASIPSDVSTDALTSSPLILEEIQKNGVLTGEISLGQTARTEESTVSNLSSGTSQDVQTTVPDDLEPSSSLKNSEETALKTTDVNRFLRFSSKTAQNESAAASIPSDVSTEALTSSPLILEEIQENSIVTGEVSLSRTTRTAESTASNLSSDASQDVQTAVPDDLEPSSSLKNSEEAALKTTDVNRFLRFSSKTAQNESAAASIPSDVSTEALTSSPLILEEIQENGVLAGEISLSQTARIEESTVSNLSSDASQQDVQTRVPDDLEPSASLKNSEVSSPKATESRKASAIGNDAFKSTFDELDLGTRWADNTLSGLTALRTVSLSSTTPQASNAGQLNLNGSSWPSDLAEQIQGLYEQKHISNLTLDLEPEGMGRLTLRVSAKRQEVAAYVSADNQQVGDLLSRNSSVLRENLQSQGLTLTNLFVDVRQGQDGNSNSFFQNSNPQGDRSATASMRQVASSQKTSLSSIRIDRSPDRLINLIA